jgi:hypothetical protein
MNLLLAAYVSTGLLVCDPAALQTPSLPPLPLMIFACQLAEASGAWVPFPRPERPTPKHVFVTQN